MPDLNTTLHIDMLNRHRRNRKNLLVRIISAVRKELAGDVYGLGWGDPEAVEPLKFIRDGYVVPYVRNDRTALEIGPGGGRWTRYLVDFKQLYVVDFYPEVLEELKRTYNRPNMRFIANNGTDFPGVPDGCIDFLFSFGAFVHMDLSVIEAYLKNMRRILKVGAEAVIHYSDKTKIMAQRNQSFSDNSPEKMRRIVRLAGYEILEEDLTSMWHSSVIRFGLAR